MALTLASANSWLLLFIATDQYAVVKYAPASAAAYHPLTRMLLIAVASACQSIARFCDAPTGVSVAPVGASLISSAAWLLTVSMAPPEL